MKKLKFQDLFHTRLQQFLQKNQKEKTVLFFRGFGRLQNAEILSCSESLYADGILNPDATLNLAALEAKKAETAKDLISSSGFRVGIYEQFLAAISEDPELMRHYNGTVEIVDDNLFSGHYVSAVPNEDARSLYEYFQKETDSVPDNLAVYFNYYGDVVSVDETHYFLAPFDRCTDEKLKIVPFFAQRPMPVPKEIVDAKSSASISGSRFLLQKAELLEGRLPSGTVYCMNSRTEPDRYAFPAFAGILDELGVSYGVKKFQGFNVTEKSSANKYLPLLQKYWGNDAAFRQLKFYSRPGSAKDTVEISQGEIISQIIAQSEKAIGGSHDFRNIFITAPTGAGKSLLFQLPAVHIAEKFGAVTIVITPLIALMKDQVLQLENEHNVRCATYINSTLSFEEREKRIAAIKAGEKSIVYVAPELLVSTPLDAITGGRKVGLFVIDEAHIVTSWGKDFRADYWYLGDFLNHLKRSGMWFPILCLTATAVYGGSEDIVNETIDSLFLKDPLIYLGSVRRDNIAFDINRVSLKSVTEGAESFKVKKAAQVVQTYVEKGEKSLVYCPFTTQVDDIYAALDSAVRPKVCRYYGTLDKKARSTAQENFSSGACIVMLCTKAFGMGIDVQDIRNVYHFAPTGSLADYVQEIGRAARRKSSQGCASADFLPTDTRYVRTLYGISEMKQYQLREMLRKIYSIYKESNRRSLLISPDAFLYLFRGRELENKVKNGMLLLSKDLESIYGYPVITVRPKAMLTKSFVNVPLKSIEKFEKKFGRFVKQLDDRTRRVLPSRNKRYESDTIVVNSGKIYELDMPAIWQNNFRDISFSQFNHRFFNGELFQCGNDEIFSPRIHIKAVYALPFQELKEKLKEDCTVISGIFRKYKSKGQVFTAKQFREDLAEGFGKDCGRLEFSNMILQLFIADMSRNIGFRTNSDRLKFIAARKTPSGEMGYRVLNSGYISMPNYFVQLVSQCAPGEENIYQAYIPLGRNSRQPERLRLLSFLELLGLASYEVHGSQNMEIFVRINDPDKLARLTAGDYDYKNSVASDIHRRHKSAQDTMMGFMMHDLSSKERWDVIEDYFLGREESVRKAIGVCDDEPEETAAE